MGTKSNPTPTRPSMANMPIRNVTVKSTNGHTHHATSADATAAVVEGASVDATAKAVIARKNKKTVTSNMSIAAERLLIVLILPSSLLFMDNSAPLKRRYSHCKHYNM